MANGVNELLDMLYRMIDDAKGGLGGTCKINRDDALDLLDEIRNKFPAELNEAKKTLARKEEILDGARADAESIRQQAMDKARQLIDEHEIVRQARAEANGIAAQAEKRAEDLKRAASDYCEDALRRTEDAVNAALNEVRQSRSKFRAISGMGPARRSSGNMPYDAEKDDI